MNDNQLEQLLQELGREESNPPPELVRQTLRKIRPDRRLLIRVVIASLFLNALLTLTVIWLLLSPVAGAGVWLIWLGLAGTVTGFVAMLAVSGRETLGRWIMTVENIFNGNN